MSNRQAAQQALEALEGLTDTEQTYEALERGDAAITALKTALEQPEQEPTCPECKAAVLYECVACSSNNYPPVAQPEHEPVAFYHPHKGFYWAKPTSISSPTVVDVSPVPLYVKWKAAQRPWQGLTDDEIEETFVKPTMRKIYQAIEAALKEKNT